MDRQSQDRLVARYKDGYRGKVPSRRSSMHGLRLASGARAKSSITSPTVR